MSDPQRHVMLVGGEAVTVNALGKVLGSAYRVSFTGTAGEALRVLSTADIDLVMCDVRQSGLAEVYASKAAANAAAPFMYFGDPRWPATHLLSDDKKRRFLPLPCDSATLLKRVRAVWTDGLAPPAPAAAAGPGAREPERDTWDISGNLDALPVEQMLQLIESTRRTGMLRLTTDRFQGSIYCVDGSVWHAALGEVEGREAVYLLVNLREGHFDFRLDERPPKRTIDDNTASLLLEGLRQRDETLSLVSTYRKKRDTGRHEKT
jgi:hypothetical protein